MELELEAALVGDDAEVDAVGALGCGHADEDLRLGLGGLALLLREEVETGVRMRRHEGFTHPEEIQLIESRFIAALHLVDRYNGEQVGE